MSYRDINEEQLKIITSCLNKPSKDRFEAIKKAVIGEYTPISEIEREFFGKNTNTLYKDVERVHKIYDRYLDCFKIK